MPQAELRVTTGKQAGNAIQLPEGKFLVGREEDCHLRPNSDLVSRHHCVFTLDEYGLRLRDLGSTNGSFVNGEKIRGAVVLNNGDSVSIGKLDFRVVIGDAVAEETRTNLEDDLPTEVFSKPEPDSPVISEGDAPTEEPSVSDTLMEMPTNLLSSAPAQEAQFEEGQQPPPAQVEGQPPVAPIGETQYFPQQGMPQMPVGYPPNMGYPPGMMPYGYPQGYPPQGYPQGYPPNMGYPPGQYPPPQQPVEEESSAPKIAEPDVRLPDPSETGVKAPEPTPPAAEGDGEKKDERTADQKAKEEAPSAAADAIQQYLQRRPKTS